MIKISPKELIDEVPDIQSVALPDNWFRTIDYDITIFKSLYNWMIKEGAVPKEFATQLHNMTYVGEVTYKKLLDAESKRIKKKYNLKEDALKKAVFRLDTGSGPISDIYNCRISGNCILVIPDASRSKLFSVVIKIFERENDKAISKIKNKAAGENFYQWLISQIERPDIIGAFAKEVKLDKEFPRDAEYCESIESYLGVHCHFLDAVEEAWIEYVSQYPQRVNPYAWCNECNQKINVEVAQIAICEEYGGVRVLCDSCVPKVSHRSLFCETPLFQITQEQLQNFTESHGLEGYEIASFIERLKIWGVFPLNETGFIYFIQSEDTRKIKIGYSVNPTDRVKTLQTGHSCPLRLLKIIPGDMKFERALHRKFFKFRVQGEWFEPHPDIIEYISKV